MCEFHESTCNGFGDIWWTDNPIYFSSIDGHLASGLCGGGGAGALPKSCSRHLLIMVIVVNIWKS